MYYRKEKDLSLNKDILKELISSTSIGNLHIYAYIYAYIYPTL